MKRLPGEPYKDIFHNSQAAMLIIDTDAPHYTMLDVNDAYLFATYTTREEIIGKPVFGVFPANPTDDVSKNVERTIFSFEQAIKNKVPHVMSNYRYDIPIPGTDEFEERYWTTSNTPVLGENGEVAYFIHSPANVTELYKLNEREKEWIEKLKIQQQQKDEFIGVASHELKTPVTSIKAYTQVLQKMLEKRGDIKEAEMIGRMDAQINRLTSLIGDLLDVTKINSGKLQFNYGEFDFNQMVKDLIEDLQRTTQKHTLIEKYADVGIVYGDKERLGQVITNLVTNAIKYSPHTDEIIISTSLKDDEVRLCVQDFGIGISKDKVDRVFEQFYRVSGDMQHTFPGLGLGLYISSEIIKREGGRIWVTSTEGKGSTFCFSLPVNAKEKGDKDRINL